MNKPLRARIFVFGSNLSGRHGAGAAKYALMHHDAIYGQNWGLQGTSFAIPTKDKKLSTLPLDSIQQHINEFIKFAQDHPEYDFLVTRIGCGLAGYSDLDIAPFFKNAPSNCFFSKSWEFWIPNAKFDESLF